MGRLVRLRGMARHLTAGARAAGGLIGGQADESPPSLSLDGGTRRRPTGSFEDFYRRHAETLRQALCLAVGHADLGTDAADEAMARACEHWDEVGGYANPSGWTYRVGLNWARSQQRRLRFRRHRSVPDVGWLPVPDDPDLADALARLSTNARAVVVCRYYLDWSVEQTAVALDIPIGTVKSRLTRSLDTLKRHLEET